MLEAALEYCTEYNAVESSLGCFRHGTVNVDHAWQGLIRTRVPACIGHLQCIPPVRIAPS